MNYNNLSSDLGPEFTVQVATPDPLNGEVGLDPSLSVVVIDPGAQNIILNVGTKKVLRVNLSA